MDFDWLTDLERDDPTESGLLPSAAVGWGVSRNENPAQHPPRQAPVSTLADGWNEARANIRGSIRNAGTAFMNAQWTAGEAAVQTLASFLEESGVIDMLLDEDPRSLGSRVEQLTAWLEGNEDIQRFWEENSGAFQGAYEWARPFVEGTSESAAHMLDLARGAAEPGSTPERGRIFAESLMEAGVHPFWALGAEFVIPDGSGSAADLLRMGALISPKLARLLGRGSQFTVPMDTTIGRVLDLTDEAWMTPQELTRVRDSVQAMAVRYADQLDGAFDPNAIMNVFDTALVRNAERGGLTDFSQGVYATPRELHAALAQAAQSMEGVPVTIDGRTGSINGEWLENAFIANSGFAGVRYGTGDEAIPVGRTISEYGQIRDGGIIGGEGIEFTTQNIEPDRLYEMGELQPYATPGDRVSHVMGTSENYSPLTLPEDYRAAAVRVAEEGQVRDFEDVATVLREPALRMGEDPARAVTDPAFAQDFMRAVNPDDFGNLDTYKVLTRTMDRLDAPGVDPNFDLGRVLDITYEQGFADRIIDDLWGGSDVLLLSPQQEAAYAARAGLRLPADASPELRSAKVASDLMDTVQNPREGVWGADPYVMRLAHEDIYPEWTRRMSLTDFDSRGAASVIREYLLERAGPLSQQNHYLAIVLDNTDAFDDFVELRVAIPDRLLPDGVRDQLMGEALDVAYASDRALTPDADATAWRRLMELVQPELNEASGGSVTQNAQDWMDWGTEAAKRRLAREARLNDIGYDMWDYGGR
jgi:hypothetical protein